MKRGKLFIKILVAGAKGTRRILVREVRYEASCAIWSMAGGELRPCPVGGQGRRDSNLARREN